MDLNGGQPDVLRRGGGPGPVSLSGEISDEPGQLDGGVALHAVAGVLNMLDPGRWLASQQFRLVGVVDYRLREHPSHEHERHGEAGDGRPELRELFRWQSVPKGLPTPVPGVTPDPRSVFAPLGVVENAPAQGSDAPRRVVLDRTSQEGIEIGKAIRTVDEGRDRRRLRRGDAGSHVDENHPADQLRVGGRQGRVVSPPSDIPTTVRARGATDRMVSATSSACSSTFR